MPPKNPSKIKVDLGAKESSKAAEKETVNIVDTEVEEIVGDLKPKTKPKTKPKAQPKGKGGKQSKTIIAIVIPKAPMKKKSQKSKIKSKRIKIMMKLQRLRSYTNCKINYIHLSL